MATDTRIWQPGPSEPPRVPSRRGLFARLWGAIRYGGAWFLRWPLRLLLLSGIVAAGFLPYQHEVGGQCRVVTGREVAIRSQLQDEIAEILVSEGDQVVPGQTIALLAARDANARLAEAQADVAYAEANLKQLQSGARAEDITKAEHMAELWRSQVAFWEAEHKRQEGLVASQAGALNTMEKALSSRNSAKAMLIAAEEEERKLRSGHRDETIDAAQALLDKAKAALKLQEDRIPLREIRSTMAGTVSTPGVNLRVGQTVSPGDLIAVVRDLSSLQLEILADESAAESVKPGQAVKIRLWGQYGDLTTGQVDHLAFTASDKAQLVIEPYRTDRETRQEQVRFHESDNRYVKVVANFDNPAPNLLVGMTGEARVVVGEDYFWNALWRPIKRFFLVEVWSWLP
ncbi:MAG: HlyD family efflux transporter periplasmic adaptor subunit [Planctomycetaceae bacterium]|nr:HlyD family efflux transporter periplasmic adaptor subunit [Planctomycetaceae bacterium]